MIFSSIWQREDGTSKYQIMLGGSHSIGLIMQKYLYGAVVSTAAAACRAAAGLGGVQPAASVTKCTSPGQPATAGHKMVQYHYTIYTLHSVLYYYTILLFKIIYI